MSEENKKLGDEKLEHAAGGNDGQFGPIDDVHNTAYFSLIQCAICLREPAWS